MLFALFIAGPFGCLAGGWVNSAECEVHAELLSCSLSPGGQGGQNTAEKVMGQDRGRGSTQQFSWPKQLHLEED